MKKIILLSCVIFSLCFVCKVFGEPLFHISPSTDGPGLYEVEAFEKNLTCDQLREALSPTGELGPIAERICSLSFFYCGKLEALPDLSSLTSLEYVWLDRCAALKDIAALFALRTMKVLDIHDCPNVRHLQLIGLSKFGYLGIGTDVNLETLILQNLPSLRSIELFLTENLRIFAFLYLPSLRWGYIYGMDSLKFYSPENAPKENTFEGKPVCIFRSSGDTDTVMNPFVKAILGGSGSISISRLA